MKSHQEIAAEIGELVAQKNLAYGDSLGMVGVILALHFPHGIPLERYDDAFLLARIFDKTMRFAENNDPHGECPLTDIAGYAIAGLDQQQRKEHDQTWQGSANGPDAQNSSPAPLPASAAPTASSPTRPTRCASREPRPTPSEPGSLPSAKTSSAASPSCSTNSAATATTIQSASAAAQRRGRKELPQHLKLWLDLNRSGRCAACEEPVSIFGNRLYTRKHSGFDWFILTTCSDHCAHFLEAQ